jgi:hypothetical protein
MSHEHIPDAICPARSARLSHPARSGEIRLRIERGRALEIAGRKTLTRPAHNNKERIYLFDKLYYTEALLSFGACLRNH